MMMVRIDAVVAFPKYDGNDFPPRIDRLHSWWKIDVVYIPTMVTWDDDAVVAVVGCDDTVPNSTVDNAVPVTYSVRYIATEITPPWMYLELSR